MYFKNVAIFGSILLGSFYSVINFLFLKSLACHKQSYFFTFFLLFFQVLCGVRARPPPSRFRWTFNNSLEANEVPQNKFSSNGSLSKLNYRAESEKDFGVVQCWAENKLGVSESPCVFTLIPAGKNIFIIKYTYLVHPFKNLILGKNPNFLKIS